MITMLTREQELNLDRLVHKKILLGEYSKTTRELKKVKGVKIGNKKMVESRGVRE